MYLLKSGQIANCCQPNALMTLAEYLVDYASPETKARGFALIRQELEKIPNARTHGLCKANIKAIAAGDARDFRF